MYYVWNTENLNNRGIADVKILYLHRPGIKNFK